MAYTRRKSIVLNSANNERVYRTFQDWQAEQLLDVRTAAQRGIQVGSPVMWRHMHKNVIVTDRAIVVTISDDDMLTLTIKDVKERACCVHVREIVNSSSDRLSLSMHEMNRNSYLSNQTEKTILS